MQCTAKSKQSGQRCKRNATSGATVCYYHGGAIPRVKEAARRRLAEQAARQAALELAIPVETSPDQALLDEVRRSAGLVAYYEARVKEIADSDPDDLVWGKTREKSGGENQGTIWEARPNVWLTLWNSERDRLVEVSAATLRAGVQERQVRIAEEQGALMAAVQRRILDRMLMSVLSAVPEAIVGGVMDAWGRAVPIVVPEELRALVAPDPEER